LKMPIHSGLTPYIYMGIDVNKNPEMQILAWNKDVRTSLK